MSDFSNSVYSGQIEFLKTLPGKVLSTVADECLLRYLEKGEVLFKMEKKAVPCLSLFPGS
jgi:hypothetical protein